ncbi:MAG: hypothetical protein LBL34_07035 [Clostridiales bacterium]|jgi:hypothetical protein|nr:hypothetical protein [Clostridiales bacterium]
MMDANDILRNIDAKQLQAMMNTPKGQQIMRELANNPDVQRVFRNWKR